MSKFRMVNTRFWSDSFIVDKCNSLDRLLFLYLLTNERTNIIGIYELPLRTAAFETGIEKDDLEKMLLRLSPKIEYFDGWVYIRRFTDHQQSNPSVDKGMMREFFALPHTVLNRVKAFGIEAPKLSAAFDMLEQAGYRLSQSATDTPQAGGNLNLNLNLNPNLTKSKDLDNTKATDVALEPVKTKKAITRKIKTEEIDALFTEWQTVVGYAVTSNVKANREYAARLIREYQADDLTKMLRGVAMSQEDQYAPRVSNFSQLYKKWDDLKAWGRRSMTGQRKNGGIKI